nr:SH3 domain-binding glutamic acid-rich-like protein 2 [Taeniopygia guttata]
MGNSDQMPESATHVVEYLSFMQIDPFISLNSTCLSEVYSMGMRTAAADFTDSMGIRSDRFELALWEDQEQPELERGAAIQPRGSTSRRCSPRPAGSAPGGRHKPLSASPRRTVAAGSPGPWGTAAGAGRLPHASVCPAAGGGQTLSWLAPGSVLRLSPPGEDYSARRALRAARTPPPLPLSLLLAARLARGRGAARAEQGRAGQSRGAAGGGHARGRRRGGAGRPRPRPVPGSGSSQPRCPVPTAPVSAAHEVKMVIRVFVASSSGSVAIKKRQQDVVRFLEANRIEFEEVDITMSEEKRQWMYKNIPEDRQPAQGNPLPPQIFSDDRYCGDYDGFFESKESNTVFSFLGLKPTLASKESEP